MLGSGLGAETPIVATAKVLVEAMAGAVIVATALVIAMATPL